MTSSQKLAEEPFAVSIRAFDDFGRAMARPKIPFISGYNLEAVDGLKRERPSENREANRLFSIGYFDP